MSMLVVDGPGGPRQIICAERSARSFVLFAAMLTGLLISAYFSVGTYPSTDPFLWFYSTVGLVLCGFGTLAGLWLLLRPDTIRVELDREGLVKRSLFGARKYRWQQIGPFAPMEPSVRSRWLPRRFTTCYAGAFNARTMTKIGEVRAPHDDELHAADVRLKATLLEHGPALKATRRFCDILNEWRSEALEASPPPDIAGDGANPKPGMLRRRARIARTVLVVKAVLLGLAILFGPIVVANWSAF